MLKTIIAILTLAFICSACSKGSVAGGPHRTAPQPSSSLAQSSQTVSGEVRYKAPEGWTVEKPISEMRVAQYKLPQAEGDGEDALLVVY